MLLRLIYEEQLAQASYLLGCQETGEAIVIDPHRDIEQYRDLAAHEGLRIVAVTETHIHADFVSGARELAARTGARLYLSGAGPTEWRYQFAAEAGATLLHDGDQFTVGALRLDVWHTPGHTPEHLSFLVTDTAHADAPMGIFTGDFVFVGDVGRPDLLERAAGQAGTMAAGARDLFGSLARFRTLPEWVQVWPGHGAGSACGKALGAVPQTTVGYETRFNPALGYDDAAAFTDFILAGQPDPPPYFARMKAINRVGPAPVAELAAPRQRTLAELDARRASGTLIVDTRPVRQYAAGAIPGTLNLPLDGGFLNWAGWLLSPERPIALIVAPDDLVRATRLLRLIGLDELAGFWPVATVAAWFVAGGERATIAPIAPEELRALQASESVTLIDVRNQSERAAGFIAGSLAIPLGELSSQLVRLPHGGTVTVHCQGGARSAIAASLLLAERGRTVRDLTGGFNSWVAAGQPVEHEAEVALVASRG